MRNRPAALRLIYMILFMLLVMVGCTTMMDKKYPIEVTPVLEQYEYKQREKVCFFPFLRMKMRKQKV